MVRLDTPLRKFACVSVSVIMCTGVVSALSQPAFGRLARVSELQHHPNRHVVASGYDKDQAIGALYYAKASYCFSGIPTWTCGACPWHSKFSSVTLHQNSSLQSQAFTGYDPVKNQAVVAFRGTVDLVNWIDNLLFFQTKFPNPDCEGCTVHEGFLAEWYGYRAPVLSSLKTIVAAHPGCGVLVTGHSLGAAVASIAVSDVYSLVSNNVVSYTFGTPRTGNHAWVRWNRKILAGRMFRVTHRRDPIPHLPAFDMGFMHQQHELWYNNEGNTTWKDCNDDDVHEDADCSVSVLPWMMWDHTRYLGQLVGCFIGEPTTRHREVHLAEAVAAAKAIVRRQLFGGLQMMDGQLNM